MRIKEKTARCPNPKSQIKDFDQILDFESRNNQGQDPDPGRSLESLSPSPI